MMVTSVHGASGAVLHTDSRHLPQPAQFSPTDLVAAGLLSCMLSIIAAYAGARGGNVEGMYGTVETTITQRPYRIQRLAVDIFMPAQPYTAKLQAGIERTVLACPIHRSLHPDVEQLVHFHWPEGVQS